MPMATSLWSNGKKACEKLLRRRTFKPLFLAMVVDLAWALRNMVALAKSFVLNIVICRILLAIYLLAAFLLPWLLLVSSYMLKVYVDLTGKVPRFGKRSKAIQ